MATPHIAGIASLITSASILPDATTSKVNYILQSTAKSFPTGTGNDCTTALCGAGIVDATAALELSSNPSADFTPKYDEQLLDIQRYTYDFSSPADKVDSLSQWYINNDKLFSNDISDNEETSYQMTLQNVDSFDLSFTYQVSSELGYDGLLFSIENEIILVDSGENTNVISITDQPIQDNALDLNWTYAKDANTSEGFDKAWIDDIEIATYKNTASYVFTKSVQNKVILIRNSGADNLLISTIDSNNSVDFNITHTCSDPIVYGETCKIFITYIGSLTNHSEVTLTYNTNASTQPSVEKTFTYSPFQPATLVPIISYLLF
jgi:hypothetical protein